MKNREFEHKRYFPITTTFETQKNFFIFNNLTGKIK